MDWQESLQDFLSQPFGVAGSLCIMAAVTCFNSRWLQRELSERLGAHFLSILLNILNMVGGICLLVNATLRDEIVWKVMETYFVLVSFKGLIQELFFRRPSA
ncbi:MAG: hypothetical protein OXT67_12285 [Zetaproteobacteria bacterium]|nr:hypothetical protein [Zetaproteobacteria bacterium]